MFASAAPFIEHMFAPARLRDKCRPAPQLHPKYSRRTGIRGLGYQDHFPWLRKKYPGRKICHKKKTSISPGHGALLFDNYEIQGDRSPDPAL